MWLSGSLKVTFRMPVSMLYDEEATSGKMTSTTAMGRSGAASIWLPLVSVTAPGSMSSWGSAIAFTVIAVELSSVTASVRLAVVLEVEPARVMPPSVWSRSRMCNSE